MTAIMMNIKALYKAAVAAAAISALAACNHKELCYDHPHGADVEVVFEWDMCPQAQPDGMTVYFYNLDRADAQPLRFDFAGRDGGIVRLPVARYEAICVNADNEYARFADTHSLSAFRAYTREADLLEGMTARSETTPVAPGTEGQKVVVYPDDIYSDTVPLTEIESLDRSYRVTFHPEDMLCHYTYEIRHVENIASLSQFSGTISHMSGEMLLASGTHPGGHSILPFGGNGDGPNRIAGAFNTFGHLPGAEDTHEGHRMMFYAVLRDGTGWSGHFDVSDQVHTAPDPRNVHIVIDRIDLPKVETGGGPFDIGVNDWIEEIVDLTM